MKETVKSSGCGLQFLLVGGDSVLSINAIGLSMAQYYCLVLKLMMLFYFIYILSMEMTQLSL